MTRPGEFDALGVDGEHTPELAPSLRELGQVKQTGRKVYACLSFPEGTTEAQVRDFLLEWRGEIHKDEVCFEDDLQVSSFDPSWGGVTLYQP